MIFRFGKLLIACVMLQVLTGCGLIGKAGGLFHFGSHAKKTDTDDAKKDLFIGLIEMVNPEQRFVLVRTNANILYTKGTLLETRTPAGTVAKLIVTPERKTNLISADIMEGLPQKGDAVMLPGNSAPIASDENKTKTDVPVSSPDQLPTHPLPASSEEMIPGVPPSDLAPVTTTGPLPPPIR
jgi:hypothetical protein